MAAVIELDESNGAVEVVTHSVATLAMGTQDATGMVPGAPGARQGPNSNSMQKALRVHLTALGGSLGITSLRVFCDPSATGWTLFMNGHTVQATYDLTKRTSYVQPAATTTAVPNAMPKTDPGVANFGIAGSLSGQLLSVGQTDYLYIQLRADGTVAASFTSPMFLAYDRIG